MFGNDGDGDEYASIENEIKEDENPLKFDFDQMEDEQYDFDSDELLSNEIEDDNLFDESREKGI